MTVEVFRTNVLTEEDAVHIISVLRRHLPESRINFDLEDCDKVLRIERCTIAVNKIIELLHVRGHHCEILD
ncbi:MAG: hypothetical protein ACTHJ0_06620 [Flavipsychrobacter sp.]